MDPGKCSCGAVFQKEYKFCTSCGKTRPTATEQLPLLGPRCTKCAIDLPQGAKFCFVCGAPSFFLETNEEGHVKSKLKVLHLKWCCRSCFLAVRHKTLAWLALFFWRPPPYTSFLDASRIIGVGMNMNPLFVLMLIGRIFISLFISLKLEQCWNHANIEYVI